MSIVRDFAISCISRYVNILTFQSDEMHIKSTAGADWHTAKVCAQKAASQNVTANLGRAQMLKSVKENKQWRKYSMRCMR